MAFIFMPLAPPEALISLIAINVASCSDFSMIDKATREREQHAHIDRSRGARRTDDVGRCKRSGCRKQATLQEFTPINRHGDTPHLPLAAPQRQASRLRSRPSAMF